MMKQANRSPLRNILLLLCTVPVAAWFSWKSREYQLDDSLIYLRYVRNLFDGFGLTYNAGDHFNGLTSPLYSYVLIAANVVTHNLQYTTIFLSFLFLCLAAIYGAAALSENRIEQVLAGFFIVSFNYFYATFGMETTLFLFLTALVLHWYRHGRLLLTGIAVGLVILTRAEGVLLGGVILSHYVLVNKRLPPLKYLALPAVILFANAIFNTLYYGSPLPATGNAKIGQGRSGYWGTGFLFLHVEYMRDWFFGGNYRLLWFMFPTAAFGIWATRHALTTRLSLAYIALLGAFYVFLRIPSYHWYYGPFFYFLLLFSAIGAFRLVQLAVQLPTRRSVAVVLATPLIAIIVAFGALNLKLADITRGSFDPYRNIGNWIAGNTPHNSSVAAAEIGTIGWYANRYVIDILGLTNPYNADFITRKDVHSWLTKYAPDYILIHDPVWPFESTADCLTQSGAYTAAPGFDFPGYRLLVKSTRSDAAANRLACGRTGGI
jgi:hypothetical protein